MDADVAAAVILELLQTNHQHRDKRERLPASRHVQGWVSGSLDIVMRHRSVDARRIRQVRAAALNLVFLQHPDLAINWPTYANDGAFQTGVLRGRAVTVEFLDAAARGLLKPR